MTNRKCFADRAPLALLVEHQTFNLRAMGSIPYRAQMEFFMFVLCMETIFSCFLSIENVHHFSNIFQLLPVLFSCSASDFLYEEFSAKTIRAKITLMPFSIRMFLRILSVLLPIKIDDKSKLVC